MLGEREVVLPLMDQVLVDVNKKSENYPTKITICEKVYMCLH